MNDLENYPLPGAEYDAVGEAVRDALKADAIVLIVYKGRYGTGGVITKSRAKAKHFPGYLRHIAKTLQADIQRADATGKRVSTQ